MFSSMRSDVLKDLQVFLKGFVAYILSGLFFRLTRNSHNVLALRASMAQLLCFFCIKEVEIERHHFM